MDQHTPTHHGSGGRRRRGALAGGVAAAAMLAVTALAPAAEAKAPAPHFQAILERAVKAPGTTFPGAALYVRGPGRRTWTGAAGKADIRSGRALRPGDRFRAGSIMKPFVAAATLQLVEEGRIGLDDPLPAVLPARVTARFPEASRITVRMLLGQTSGLADYTDAGFDREVLADPLRRWTTAEFLDRAAALPRVGAPGERFSYSNANYNLLGAVLEQATGKPWRAVVRERVIERLGLRHTSLPQPGHRPAGAGIAHAYQPVGGRLVDVTNVDSSMAGAAGGHALLTTTEDLTRFLHALLAGRLFRHRETLREMRTFMPDTDPNGRDGYGLGLERYRLPGGVQLVGHMGTSAGYRALMFHVSGRDTDFTMLITTPDDPSPVLVPVLERLAAQS